MLGVIRRRVVSGGSSPSVTNSILNLFTSIWKRLSSIPLNVFVLSLRFWGSHCIQSDLLQTRRFILNYVFFLSIYSWAVTFLIDKVWTVPFWCYRVCMAVFITEIVFMSTSKCTVVYCNFIFMCLGTDSISTQRRIGSCAKCFSPHFRR